MRLARLAPAVALLLACSSSGGGGSGGGGTCADTFAACDAVGDCCSRSCLQGYCMPSGEGGACRDSSHCAEPLACVGGTCRTATCRVDSDVCSLDAQCCAANCTLAGRCAPNSAPTARAGGDRTAPKRATVTLDATGSSDADGDPLAFAWTLAVPDGSAAAVSPPDAAQASFRTDVVGVYTATVTVRDGTHANTATVHVTVANTPPVVQAGGDRTVPRNVPVQLDASASTDVDQDPLRFAWTLGPPDGSASGLSAPTDPRPTFTPDRLGPYAVAVRVDDGTEASTARFTVTAVNTSPVGRVTGPATVNAGEPVTLDASGSTDLNSDALAFTWSLVEAPTGSAAAVTAEAGARSGFTTDLEGAYVVDLAASDGIDTTHAQLRVYALPHLARLPHDVVASAYDPVSDRLLLASASPVSALYVFDPATETEQRVDLPAGPPRSVAVSPDGLVAVVGRTGGITAVELATGVPTDCALTWTDSTVFPAAVHPYDAAYVAVASPVGGTKGNTAPTRWAYAAPGDAADRGDYIVSVDLTASPCGGSVSGWTVDYWLAENPIALRPGQQQLYHLNWYSSPALDVFSTSSGPMSGRTTAYTGYDTLRDFWFLEDGKRLLVASGDLYDATPVSSYPSWNLSRVGRLGNPGPYDPTHPAKHASSSVAATAITIIPAPSWDVGTEDERIEAWSVSSLTLRSSTPLVAIASGGGAWTTKGLAVFYRSDGTRRYVVVRNPADASPTVFAIEAFPP